MPTALIVEDEPEANRLLSMLLQLGGYGTESAFTGVEALDKVDRGRPDMVFLDLMLPDINGYEVCKSLKTSRATSLIPVIMVTARLAAENRIQSFGVGADDYVSKPYTPDQIFQAMRKASAWSGRTGKADVDGLIPIDPAAEVETLRLLGQLRSLLVGRTMLDLEAIQSLAAALEEISHDATRWARGMRHPLDTALGFRLKGDRLTITLRDASGWLASTSLETEERWPVAFPSAGFDDVVVEEPGHRITFHKWCPPCEPTIDR